MTTDITSVFIGNWRDLILAGKAHRRIDTRLDASCLAGFALLAMLCFVSASGILIEVEQ